MEWADRNYQANNNRPTVLCQHVRHSQSSGDIIMYSSCRNSEKATRFV